MKNYIKLILKNIKNYLFFYFKNEEINRLILKNLYYFISIFFGWLNYFRVIILFSYKKWLKFLIVKFILIPFFIIWLIIDFFFKIFIIENPFDSKIFQYRKEYKLKHRYIPLLFMESIFFLIRPFWRFYNTFILLYSLFLQILLLIYMQYFYFLIYLINKLLMFLLKSFLNIFYILKNFLNKIFFKFGGNIFLSDCYFLYNYICFKIKIILLFYFIFMFLFFLLFLIQ